MKIPTKKENTFYLAEGVLQHLGVEKPNQKQTLQMQSILASVGVVFADIQFDKTLTARECACLYWLAKGKIASEIANLMNIAETTVRTYFSRIKTKLNCKTLEQAMYEGMRFCFVSPSLTANM